MTFDAKALCPGGTGKKIKHCSCRDISGDLEKIMRAMEGEQRIAALSQINRLLATKAHRPCLLSLKILNLLDMKDLQGLEETTTTFVKVAPDNPLAHTYAAILEARKHNSKAAVNSIQSALENAEEFFPGELYDALQLVAQLLAAEGKYLAARAHLLHRVLITGNQEEEAVRELIMLESAEGVPLLMKRTAAFQLDGGGKPWSRLLEQLSHPLARGEWRKGLQKLEQLDQQYPGEPVILWNMAVAQSNLGIAKAADTWHRYAMLESVGFETAVIAEAVSQLLGYATTRRTVGLVKLTVSVTDAAALQERLLSSKVVAPSQVNPAELREEGAPPPKAVFQLLDRPLPASGADLTLEQTPCVMGQLLLYGRETDREARLELLVAKGPRFDQVRGMVDELVGDLRGDGGEQEQILDTLPLESVELFPTLRFPRDTSLAVRRQLANEAGKAAFAQRWLDLPQKTLGDQTPNQVAGDPAYRVALAASLLVHEQIAELEGWPADVDQMRRHLSLPVPEPIDPTRTDPDEVEASDWYRIEVEKLSDEQLVALYSRAGMFHARKVLRRTGEELLNRPQLGDQVDMALVSGSLAQITNDPEESLAYLRQARELSEKAGKSPARWYLAELPLRLLRGEVDETRHLMTVLQTRHMKEPGIAEGLYNILLRFGLITPEGRPASVPEAAAPEAPAQSAQRIWTPGAPAAPAAPAAAENRESKIWVPGMD